jgi:methylthioribulose-1-phosphate dehydratase
MSDTLSIAKSLGPELCCCVAELNAHGWCQGTGGNFSVILSHDPLEILITQSGKDKGHLLADKDLVRVDGKGRPLPGETGKPSAETLLHAVIAELWKDTGCILHTHSIWNTLLGEHFAERGGFHLTGYEMIKGLSGIDSHEREVLVPVLPNSQDMRVLAGEIRDLYEEGPETHGFLLAGHGLYTWGRDIHDALRHVEIFEFLFEVIGRRTPFHPFKG